MAKRILTSDNGPVDEVQTGEREKRWEAHVARYKQENPVKAAAKEVNGEFDKIPPSFR